MLTLSLVGANLLTYKEIRKPSLKALIWKDASFVLLTVVRVLWERVMSPVTKMLASRQLSVLSALHLLTYTFINDRPRDCVTAVTAVTRMSFDRSKYIDI